MSKYTTEDGFIVETSNHKDIVICTIENPYADMKTKHRAEKVFSELSKEYAGIKELKEDMNRILMYFGFWHTKNPEREVDAATKTVYEVSNGKFNETSKTRVVKALHLHFDKMEKMNQYE